MTSKSFLIPAAAALIAGGALMAQAHGPGGGSGYGAHGFGMESLIERYDADGDGAVTRDEARQAAAKRFAEADANGDGTVSRGEWIDARDAARQNRRDARFAALDADGDGKVSQEELSAHAARRAAARFKRMDRDGDGALSRGELVGAHDWRGGWGRGWGRGGHMFGPDDWDRGGPMHGGMMRGGWGDGPGGHGHRPPGWMHGWMGGWMHGDDAGSGRRGGFGAAMTRDEIDARATRMFDRLDADGDGVVTAKEAWAGGRAAPPR